MRRHLQTARPSAYGSATANSGQRAFAAKIGERIAQLNLPTLFVMEGGYAVAEIGVNAVSVLTGFEGA